MKVEFLVPVELEVIESFDDALDDAESTSEVFSIGEKVEFDIFGYAERMIDGKIQEDNSFWNVQFPDGSVSFGLSKDWFKVISD